MSFPVSVIIPAFNEQRRLPRTLDRIAQYAGTRSESWEILVIDDGSADETANIATQQPAVRRLRNERNRGKGFSVRCGMLAAQGARLLMCDADLSTPIEEIAKLEAALDAGAAIAIASRDMPDSRLDPPQPPLRRMLAGAFRGLRRRLLLPHIRDTQCGFKLFDRSAARAIFERAREDGYLFDCEALVLAEKLGFRVSEVGVRWENDPESRVRPVREALHVLTALRRIRRLKNS